MFLVILLLNVLIHHFTPNLNLKQKLKRPQVKCITMTASVDLAWEDFFHLSLKQQTLSIAVSLEISGYHHLMTFPTITSIIQL